MPVDYPAEVQYQINQGKAIALSVEPLPLYKCPNCYDTGTLYYFEFGGEGPIRHVIPGEKGIGSKWLNIDGRGEGWYTGKQKSIPCPACSGNRIAEWLTSRCGLVGSDLEITLGDFKPLPGKEEVRRLAEIALGMNRNASGFLTFYGGYGRGKSMILKAMVNGFRLVGVFAVYTTLANLLANIREKFGGQTGVTAEQTILYFREVRVLCIDELDKVNLTDWTKETIARLLDARYNERERYLTALAMNTPPGYLPPELGYLSSRMIGGQVAEVAGEDMRPFISQNERKDWE